MKDNENIDIEDLEVDYLMPEELLVKSNKYKKILNNKFSSLQESERYDDRTLPETFDETVLRFKMDQNAVGVFINNINIDIKFKKIYAIVLLVSLVLQLILVNIIFLLKGLDIIKYSDVAFNIFISGAFIEVVSLVIIVVRYLFKDNISESLNVILEKNHKK